MISSPATKDGAPHNTSDVSQSDIKELTESFQKLLMNASGDLETLKTFDTMLSNEIERVSNNGSDQEDETPLHNEDSAPITDMKTQNAGWLLSDMESPYFIFEGTPFDIFKEDLLDKSTTYDKKFSNRTVAYYGDHPYSYSGAHHKPRPFQENAYLSEIIAKVRELLPDIAFNSAMVTKYDDPSSHIPFHSDVTTERSIEPGSLLLTVSLGQTRKIEFRRKSPFGPWSTTIDAAHGAAYTMTQASQDIFEHAVHEISQEEFTGPRLSITFRQMYAPPSPPPLTPLRNGFQVHPSRDSVNTRNTPVHTDTHGVPPPKHLIIGDSLAIGLQVPDDNVIICRGGIRPHEVLQLLPGSCDILHPSQYDDIKTVTLIVGTNALNVHKPGGGMPLLDVIEDYEKLFYDLKKLFPNSRIGLFNVLPRAYTCVETCRRIEIFNTIFDEHVSNRLPRVSWIRLFWELLDDWGFLRRDLYGKRGVHLKPKGKALMVKSIRKFQSAFK